MSIPTGFIIAGSRGATRAGAISGDAGAERSHRVAVDGELDLATTGWLENLLEEALARPDLTDLVVDLGGVTFLDCASIGVLMRYRNRAVARGIGFRVVHVQARPMRVLALTGVGPLLTGPAPVRSDQRHAAERRPR